MYLLVQEKPTPQLVVLLHQKHFSFGGGQFGGPRRGSCMRVMN